MILSNSDRSQKNWKSLRYQNNRFNIVILKIVQKYSLVFMKVNLNSHKMEILEPVHINAMHKIKKKGKRKDINLKKERMRVYLPKNILKADI